MSVGFACSHSREYEDVCLQYWDVKLNRVITVVLILSICYFIHLPSYMSSLQRMVIISINWLSAHILLIIDVCVELVYRFYLL